jgi:predicted AAA+ superfamily ATPase
MPMFSRALVPGVKPLIERCVSSLYRHHHCERARGEDVDSRLNAFLERADAVLARIEPLLPTPRQAIDWTQCLAARWQREGRSGFLLPLEVSLDTRLTDLIGVDRQVEQLGRNTQQFLDGMPANHALLWGSRGTGKSSLVRALLAEHAQGGLRLIEIERDHLADSAAGGRTDRQTATALRAVLR